MTRDSKNTGGPAPSEYLVHVSLFALMVIWGLNLTVVKVLIGYLSAIQIAWIRMAVAAIALALSCVVVRLPFPRWRLQDWGLAVLASLFLVYLNQIAFVNGLQKTTATNAALIMALSPGVSTLLEKLFFKRSVGTRRWIGMLLAFCGVATVVIAQPGAEFGGEALGDFWIFLSVTAFAMGGICVQRLWLKGGGLWIGAVAHLLGATFLYLDMAFRSAAHPAAFMELSSSAIAMTLFSGLLATAMGSIIWNAGISRIGVGRTALYLSWVPIFGVIFGALLMRESLTIFHGVGLAGVLAGTLLGQHLKMGDVIRK